jgi:hypothetical protein
VDKGCCFQRLARFSLRQFLRRQLAECFVDQRQELIRSVRIALVDSGEDARNVVHGSENNCRAHVQILNTMLCESEHGLLQCR